jgi:CIC family chloride channel protein
LIPSAHLSPGACALVAMAAVFGSASRATFTFIVFAFEIVHDFNAVLPLMLVSVTADAVAMRYLPNSIMTEKLARRGLHTHHQYESNVMKQVKVADVMTRDVTTVSAEMTVRELADRLANHDPALRHHRAFPIIDTSGRLAGLITQSDLLRALEKDPGGQSTVLDAGTHLLAVAYPDERIFDAISKMLENNIGQLPVVDHADQHRLVGYINRSSVIQSWAGHFDEESVRERGWIRQWLVDFKKRDESSRGTATGRVTYLADDRIRIMMESNEVESAEEFALKAPARGVSVGDAVRVSYQNKGDGKYVLRIEELSRRQ